MTTTTITDEFINEMLKQSRTYTLVLLKAGPNYGAPEAVPRPRVSRRSSF